MLRLTDLKLPLDHADGDIASAVLERLRIAPQDLRGYAVFRRAVDARKRSAIALIYALDIDVKNETAVLARCKGDPHLSPAPDLSYRFVSQAPAAQASRPVVIGTGPCGLFAGLILAQMGFRPILLERGKVVRERTKDTWGLWRKSVLNPESNVQFGEGGAGTFSDGKLHSQIKDPHHYGRKVLTEFVKAGAPPEILYLAKPHVGTFRLVTVVENMRRTIEELGGEYRFQSKVTDFEIDERPDGGRRIAGVMLEDGTHIATDHVVLAVGHSARDTFEMLKAARDCDRAQAVLHRLAHRASAIAHRRAAATAHLPAMSCWARPTTSSLITARTGARSTASACAPAALWWPRPPSRGASSPTA